MAEICRAGPDPDSRSQADLPGGGKVQVPTLDRAPEAAFHPQMPAFMALTVPGLARSLCTGSASSLAGLKSGFFLPHSSLPLYLVPPLPPTSRSNMEWAWASSKLGGGFFSAEPEAQRGIERGGRQANLCINLMGLRGAHVCPCPWRGLPRESVAWEADGCHVGAHCSACL